MNTKDTSVDELIAALERHAGLVRAAQSCTDAPPWSMIPREEGQRIVKALSRAGVKHGALVAISSLLARCAVLTIRLARLEARCEAIDAAVKGATAPLVARIAALEAAAAHTLGPIEERLAQLEARPKGMSYRGIYDPGRVYEPSDVVTHAGSMWVALRSTGDTPGTDDHARTGWQLCVKKGRDAR